MPRGERVEYENAYYHTAQHAFGDFRFALIDRFIKALGNDTTPIFECSDKSLR